MHSLAICRIFLGVALLFGAAAPILTSSAQDVPQIVHRLRTSQSSAQPFWSTARDLNDRGQIVGISGLGDRESYATLWADGAMVTLSGGDQCEAYAINNLGTIVGFCITEAGSGHGALWMEGNRTDLGTFWPNDINDRGEIVGLSGDYAALWKDGALTNLGTLLGGSLSEAVAINEAGQIVGWSESARGERLAVLWENGEVIILGEPPVGTMSNAVGINDDGLIVGWSSAIGGWEHAVLWQDGLMTDLGMLPGHSISMALGVNNLGQIVGLSSTRSIERHAVLWQDGELVELGALPGDSQSAAAAINEVSQIAGWAGPDLEERRAVLWVNGELAGELPSDG